MLGRECSKSFKLGFNSTWTKDFQMYKLDIEKAEEPEIKLPTSAGSWEKQGNSRKTSTSALLTTLKPLTVWITRNWKILKEMRIPDYLMCLLRNLYAIRKLTVGTRLVQNWKRTTPGCILSPCWFNLDAEYIMWNARLDESQVGTKIAERNINSLRYADDTTLTAKIEEEI